MVEGGGRQSNIDTQIEKPSPGELRREGQRVLRTKEARGRYWSQNLELGMPVRETENCRPKLTGSGLLLRAGP